jgi:hypothetical protein
MIRVFRIGVLVLAGLCGCATPRSADIGLTLAIGKIEIPAGSAHRVFQGGKPVGGAGILDPYCELEIATVSEQAQHVAPVRATVTRVSQSLLKDPTTRIPALIAGIDCSEPVFRETIWWLAPDRPSPVLWLRCLAPYFNCRIGGPLVPAQIQAVVGQEIRIEPPAWATSR